MIEIRDLEKVYKTEETETAALCDIGLDIDRGEFVAVMGPSGCGKTTLLNIIGLLDTPTRGIYRFDDREVSDFSERERADFRKRHMGFIFQNYNLIDELNVAENVELPLIYLKMKASERKKKVETLLERMNIIHRKKHYPYQLSGGQQQRVAVARAVIADPELILADEPTGNLDSGNGAEVMDILTGLNESGTTIVMVTHSASDAEYARRIIHLFDGRIVTENLRVRV